MLYISLQYPSSSLFTLLWMPMYQLTQIWSTPNNTENIINKSNYRAVSSNVNPMLNMQSCWVTEYSLLTPGRSDLWVPLVVKALCVTCLTNIVVGNEGTSMGVTFPSRIYLCDRKCITLLFTLFSRNGYDKIIYIKNCCWEQLSSLGNQYIFISFLFCLQVQCTKPCILCHTEVTDAESYQKHAHLHIESDSTTVCCVCKHRITSQVHTITA